MTRVVHTGDTHIGYRQYHSPERRRDFLAAFEQVIDDAIDVGVDAVVHAGDLFHDRRPELSDLLGTLSVLRRLDDAEIPFLAIVGNHESTRGEQWLDLFERLGLAVRLGAKPVSIGDVAFYGLDHVPVSRRSDLDYEFDALPSDASYAVLVGHGLFTPFAHANWDTETVLEESSVSFDAVLLGDNHAAGTERVDGTWVTYCGSTERASASEEPARGYNVVRFDAEQSGTDGVDVRQRSIDTRPFAFVTVELAPGEGVERVREQVRQYDLEDAVAIVDILGDGEPVAPADVESFAIDRGALVARVTDRREVDTDRELSVSFADPDEAVKARVRELGLSTAGIEIDETIRASKLAESNVRSAVVDLVDEHLENGLEGLARADPESSAEPASDAVEAQSNREESPKETTESPSDGDKSPSDGDESPSDGDESSSGGDESPSDGDESSSGGDESSSDVDKSSCGEDGSDVAEGPASDGQVSMEEYQ